MDNAMIARNARKHYSMKGGVPVWNPSLARFFILETDRDGLPYFCGPTPADWLRLAKAGKRKAKAPSFRPRVHPTIAAYLRT